MIRTYQNLEFFQINKTLTDRAYLIVLLLIFLFQFSFPKYSGLAYQTVRETVTELEASIFNSLPSAKDREYSTIYVTATAYASVPEQTDSTPCQTANGFDLCKNNQENVIACNFLPFGAKVKFPDIDPDTIYTVQDRMHPRFAYRVDFWKKSNLDAHNFGKRTLRMEIYE